MPSPSGSIAKGRVTFFDVEFESQFTFGGETFVQAGYGVEQLDEVEARALYDRLRSGLEELYGKYEEETVRDAPLIGRSATWSAPDGRWVGANLIHIPANDEGWAVMFMMAYDRGIIAFPRSED